MSESHTNSIFSGRVSDSGFGSESKVADIRDRRTEDLEAEVAALTRTIAELVERQKEAYGKQVVSTQAKSMAYELVSLADASALVGVAVIKFERDGEGRLVPSSRLVTASKATVPAVEFQMEMDRLLRKAREAG